MLRKAAEGGFALKAWWGDCCMGTVRVPGLKPRRGKACRLRVAQGCLHMGSIDQQGRLVLALRFTEV